MSQPKAAAMFANWPHRFTEALRRREDSAKGVCSRLGVCVDTAKRLLRGERPGADVLMLACQVYGPAFTLELMHPGSDAARDAQLAAQARAFAQHLAEMDRREAA